MRSTLSLVCLLLLAVSVWAAPAPHALRKRAFKVERVRNPNFRGHNTPRQLLKAHRKYGIRPPQALVDKLRAQDAALKAAPAAAAANSKKKGGHQNKGGAGADAGNATTVTVTVTATPTAGAPGSSSTASSSTAVLDNADTGAGVGTAVNTPTSGDVEYLAPVTIGGQTLNLDFDTGSSDLWVFNTQLSPQQQGAGHTLFDPAQSATFAALRGATFFVSYGDGSQVAGTVGTDTVDIGGATVTRQAVELATAVSSSFVDDVSSDGLLGLAFSSLNTVQPAQQKTFFDNVLPDLAAPVFTADLRHNANGAYEFGAIDPAKFSGALTFVDVNTTQGFWQFASSRFAVGDGALQAGGAGQAIADTGTTLLLANANIVNAYYSGVAGAVDSASAGGVTVPCDAALPDLQLEVGGAIATVKGADLLFEAVADNVCFGGLQAIDSDLMIFGDIFFKSNFVVFNAGNNTLGFAPHA